MNKFEKMGRRLLGKNAGDTETPVTVQDDPATPTDAEQTDDIAQTGVLADDTVPAADNDGDDEVASLSAAEEAAFSEGRRLERQRIMGILKAGEAEGRSGLAETLAADADMPVDKALAILGSAAKEAKTGSLSGFMDANAPDAVPDDAGPETPATVGDQMAQTLRALGRLKP